MSQSQSPFTTGTDATATSSARSPGVPPRHGSSAESPFTLFKLDGTSCATVPKRDPRALLCSPRVSPVVSGLLTVIGGSLMNSSPKMDPSNRASKSRRHSPVAESRKPLSDIGLMSILTPGGKGTPKTFVVRPHTGGPSNVDTSKSRWITDPERPACLFTSVTVPSVVAPDAS